MKKQWWRHYPLREWRDSLSNAAQKLIGVEYGFFAPLRMTDGETAAPGWKE